VRYLVGIFEGVQVVSTPILYGWHWKVARQDRPSGNVPQIYHRLASALAGAKTRHQHICVRHASEQQNFERRRVEATRNIILRMSFRSLGFKNCKLIDAGEVEGKKRKLGRSFHFERTVLAGSCIHAIGFF
jgi:hypothetical protein